MGEVAREAGGEPMTSGVARMAWGPVALVLLGWLAALVLTATGVAPRAGTGAPLSVPEGNGHVVLVGVPGLTWNDLEPTSTPTLSRLAEEGGSAALVLRGTHEVTCATDAWLTVGAGERAGTAPGCVDDRPVGAEPTTLADLATADGTCVSSEGDLAALAASGPTGATAPAACRIHLVSTDVLPPAEADAAVAEVEASLPAGATLIVAGLGHTTDRAEAMALIVSPGPGALTSGSTRQRSLVQLTDLTPTLLHLAGVPDTDATASLTGRPITAAGDDTAPDLTPVAHVATVAEATDLARAISQAKAVAVPVLAGLFAVVLPLLLLAGLRRQRPATTLLATVALATPAAAFLAGLVPWWRTGAPAFTLTLVILGIALALAITAWVGPWRRDRLAPAAVVAALTLLVLGVDTLLSARLGLVSVLGLQPLTAGRFYGQGNVGFGIMLGAVVVLSGALLTWLGRAAAAAIALLGLGATVLGAAGWAGADFGAVPALVVATGLLVLAALGMQFTVARVLGLGVLGALAAAAVLVADWARGPDRRTHLGDFVQRVLDGEAWAVVARKLDQSVGILLSYPVAWLAVLALALVALVVARRPAWAAPLWRHAGLHPAAVAGLVALVPAWALNDSGIAVVALALTMLIAAALTVLDPRDITEAASARVSRRGGARSPRPAGGAPH